MSSNPLSRRQFLKLAASSAAALAVTAGPSSSLRALPADQQRKWQAAGQEVKSLASFDQTLKKFMQDRNIPCGALAVTRNSKLVLARSYTWSAKQSDLVQPDSLFRIASLSKMITSAAVLRLVQEHKLQLSATAVDLLKLTPPKGMTADPRLKDITVLHLLQHLGGWDRDKAFDPMFYDKQIAKALGGSLPISAHDIINYMTGQSLQYAPGSTYAYSNFGYCLLGRIVEQVSDQRYGAYVQNNVLEPLGIRHMKLAHSLLAQRAPGEVPYYTQDTKLYPSVFKVGKVPISYGTFNIENMDAHGGWIASPIDMVRFASSYDRPGQNPVLNAASVKIMFAEPAIGLADDGSYYACGWSVRPLDKAGRQNTWHTGSLPGTSTIVVRRWDGLNWAALFDQRDDASGLDYDAIDDLLHQAADAVTVWPDHDLFGQYQ